MDTLLETPWALWIILALIAAILEMVIPMFTFSFVSIAAGVTALISLKFGWAVQAVVFVIASLFSIWILRPRLLKRFQKHHVMMSRSQALVGARGIVTEEVDTAKGTGRVMVEGQDWAAKSQNPISVGKSAQVENHDGIVLIIKEI